LEITRPIGRPTNIWQDEVRENGGIVSGEEREEKLYNRQERKKHLRMAMNSLILHMSTE
jgi:hypothetical protein